MSIYALFWFDVEDYITPESDDALKGLLEIFEAHGVQATWKLVAEKARVLEERGRADIIRLLQRQDIGYHTDDHSQHPVLAEYLRDMGWEDGVQEVFRHEAAGYRDLTRICGPSSTFGQAGGSWAPQLYPVLQDLDIPLFMDESGHIGLDGEPFRYCRVLHINRMQDQFTRMNFTAGEAGLNEGVVRFDAICDMLGDRGGLVSIYYHPCEWATTAFWDGVNFGKGVSPPRRDWRPAPLRTAQEMRDGLELFSQYLGHVVARPDVEILTGRQVINLLPDLSRDLHLDIEDVADLVDFADGAIGFRRLQHCALAPSELFVLVAEGLLRWLSDDEHPVSEGHLHVHSTPYGPTRRIASSPTPGTPLPTGALLAGAADALQFVEVHERLPDSIWLGSERMSPADFLATAAELLRSLTGVRGSGDSVPESVALRPGQLTLEHYIHDDPWNWIIFPPDFDAPAILELGRLQTWTLKPAILQGE